MHICTFYMILIVFYFKNGWKVLVRLIYTLCKQGQQVSDHGFSLIATCMMMKQYYKLNMNAILCFIICFYVYIILFIFHSIYKYICIILAWYLVLITCFFYLREFKWFKLCMMLDGVVCTVTKDLCTVAQSTNWKDVFSNDLILDY